MLPEVSQAPDHRPLGELPHPRLLAQQHLRPEVLKALEQYRAAELDKEYEKQLWKQYWGNLNGATTDGVLHLAYCPDGPAAGTCGLPLNVVHPDIVRAEYECIETVLNWMIGECEGGGGALVLCGQSGCGKSRCLQYLRAIRFERCLPTLVTDTSRSTFDLYVEGGPFFNVPPDLVRGLRPLEPVIALIDVTADSPNRFPPPFAESAIPNMYAVLATSGNIEDSYALSKKFKPVLFYPLDLWPDNEFRAIERLLHSSSHWLTLPHQPLHPLSRPQSGTHLPPRSSIIQPLSSTADATPATPRLRLRMVTSLHLAQAPPSRFLPLVADQPFASQPPRMPNDSSIAFSARHYTLLEAVELLGRIVRDPIDLVYRRQVAKSVPPSLKLSDLLEEEGRFEAALDLVVEELSRESPTRVSSRLSSCSKIPLFDKMFFQVPTPGVARPTYDYPRLTTIPASPAWAAWIRTRLWTTPHPRTALALSAILA
ncbi:hypothetical protein NBRC10513_007587 [Rhodotorula toruloides]